jgi:predicted ester cyclase
MSADAYRALAQLYIDSVNANDEEGLAAAFAENFLDHNNAQVSGLPPGLQGVIVAHRMLHESFPDLKFTLHQTLVEENKVAIRVSARGTHTGAFYGIPPTNKVITWNALRILRVANGKFVEGVNQFDQLGILQQLGVIPSS